ncbi:MAG: transcriptional regulator [Gammaproteobacteria bacterium]|nr:transcriptional regulator [Gammaproteobacteria bacterium]
MWRVFDQTPFEKRLINGGVNTNDAINALDWQKYFKLLGMPTALEPQMAADALCADGMLERNLPDNWNITNLGAILLAEDLRDFSGLWQKAVRVVQYAGKSNIEANRERVFHRGYAVGFEQLMDYIDALLPTKEVIGRIFRETVSMYSIPAVRELVANMLVHQDLAMTGCGPMVEIYSNRVEITNPGESLVKLNRLVDVRPQTRNKAMAAIMRRAGICEELGSGIRNAILAIESAQLPPPRFETLPDFMRVTIYARQDFKDMSRTDRLRAVYQHACLRYVLGEKTSNVSLRQRFGISSRSTTTVSRLLNEALKAEMIVAEKPDASTRSRNYLPNWAAPPPAQASDH